MSADGDFVAASDGETISVFEIWLNENGKLTARERWSEKSKSQITKMSFGGNQNFLINSKLELKIIDTRDKNFFKLR